MSCILNSAFTESSTPTRKRKRVSDINVETKASAACFTNSGFTSTPKNVSGRRRKVVDSKEDSNPFLQHTCLEVKSIADIVQETHNAKLQKQEKAGVTQPLESESKNPYEVVRKPAKKKKRETEIVEACFENAALNLELPEKQFNPYEVHRQPLPTVLPQAKGHVNEALNLRGQDVPATRNPFEIARSSAASIAASNPAGVENMGMTESVPTNLKIGLPFTPTVGCRIDFKNMPLAQLTPSKMLAEKLVFSPVPGPKRSLGAISEESSMDIGRELDRYQLELENSINEAKLRKNCGVVDGLVHSQTATVVSLQVELDQKITFTQKLSEITEGEEEVENASIKETIEITENSNENSKIVFEKNPPIDTTFDIAPINDNLVKDKFVVAKDVNEDIAYASSDEEDDLDFKSPAPFVRAYRRATSPKLTVSKESLNSVKSDKSADSAEHKKQSSNVKNLIRKSIRKLMHPTQSTNSNNENAGDKHEKSEKHTTNIIASIRQSLRRKPSHKHLVEDKQEEAPIAVLEMSIIDSSERTMKLKATAPESNELINEKKHSLRHSIRQSTRELRQQVMKSVFHKNQEEYAFSK